MFHPTWGTEFHENWNAAPGTERMASTISCQAVMNPWGFDWACQGPVPMLNSQPMRMMALEKPLDTRVWAIWVKVASLSATSEKVDPVGNMGTDNAKR